MNGLILIDKPEGISSFGVVSRVRWLLTQEQRSMHQERGFCTEMQPGRSASSAAKRTDRYDERAAQAAESRLRSEPIKHTSLNRVNDWRCKCRVKVGHTGTLDPAATGLLVLAVGSYTKKVPELIKQDKIYKVTMTLGKTSTTGDKEGEIIVTSPKVPSLQKIESALKHFTGDIMQTPPAFSAIKINGQRAYDLARKGQEVNLEPRPAKIYDNNLTDYTYPFVKFTSHVGSGTYIRSLVQDIGKHLDTGAYMSDLRRTQIGIFSIESAHTLFELENTNPTDYMLTL